MNASANDNAPVELLYLEGCAIEVAIPAAAYAGDLVANAAALAKVVRATARAVAIAAAREDDGDPQGVVALAMQGVAALADLQQFCAIEAMRRHDIERARGSGDGK